jgi:translation initiation factor 2B subunit (eIF-2B alpha/beta/delta family)
LEEKEISEVWSEGPSNISIRNLYFDVTPKFFITGIITERQKIRPDELIRISREMMNYRYII